MVSIPAAIILRTRTNFTTHLGSMHIASIDRGRCVKTNYKSIMSFSWCKSLSRTSISANQTITSYTSTNFSSKRSPFLLKRLYTTTTATYHPIILLIAVLSLIEVLNVTQHSNTFVKHKLLALTRIVQIQAFKKSSISYRRL